MCEPNFLANPAETVSEKNIQTCAPSPDRDRFKDQLIFNKSTKAVRIDQKFRAGILPESVGHIHFVSMNARV